MQQADPSTAYHERWNRTPVSGRQYVLRRGGYAATIASVGASLRRLRHEGRDLVVGYSRHQVRPSFRGAVLAPWPNRVVDGRYTYNSTSHQLPINEPERGHALHGLVLWHDFTESDSGPQHVTLSTVLQPQLGYPFRLHLSVSYRLTDDGLRTVIATTNLGPDPAPYGIAAHPYLSAGHGPVDDWTLTLPARRVLQVSPDRLIPQQVSGVETIGFDFRTPRRLGDIAIDHAFTGLAPGDGGEVLASVTAPDGSGVGMAWDLACPWVQVHTSDALDRTGLALEPMTCPPDAFNSGEDLLRLEPLTLHSVGWRIFAIHAGEEGTP